MYGETVGGNFKRWLQDTLGFRGSKNAVSWIVAGGLAYYFIYLPEQRKAEELRVARELAKQRAIEAGTHDMDRARPIPDPQDTGLLKGARAKAAAEAASKAAESAEAQQQQQQ